MGNCCANDPPKNENNNIDEEHEKELEHAALVIQKKWNEKKTAKSPIKSDRTEIKSKKPEDLPNNNANVQDELKGHEPCEDEIYHSIKSELKNSNIFNFFYISFFEKKYRRNTMADMTL